MAQIATEKDQLHSLLSASSVAAELADAGRRLKSLDEELHTIEERWLHLTEQIDNMG